APTYVFQFMRLLSRRLHDLFPRRRRDEDGFVPVGVGSDQAVVGSVDLERKTVFADADDPGVAPASGSRQAGGPVATLGAGHGALAGVADLPDTDHQFQLSELLVHAPRPPRTGG